MHLHMYIIKMMLKTTDVLMITFVIKKHNTTTVQVGFLDEKTKHCISTLII